jgi:hypothetical protein
LQLKAIVHGRKSRIAKANYQEKVDTVSSPYMLVGQIKNIEVQMWINGYDSAPSKVFSTLCNRYIYLRTLGTLLHGKSLFKEELSDCFLVEHHAKKDPHMMEIAVSQIATRKTNKNYKLFGRLCRHKDVRMCGFGALGFYLFYRFECTASLIEFLWTLLRPRIGLI